MDDVGFRDRRGYPISRATWAWLSADVSYVRLREDTFHLGDIEACVATFWLGLAARSGFQRGALFLTVVDDHSPASHLWTWSTEASANRGHTAIVRKISREHRVSPLLP